MTLLTKLPDVKGKLIEFGLLQNHTWFKVGGPADILFTPEDTNDLINFVKNCPKDIPLTPLGAGSNVLVRDGGISGVVICTKKLNNIEVEKNIFNVECGALDMAISRVASKYGISGLEFLIGIPGSIGGAFKMNAGSFGKETKNILVEAKAIDREGIIHSVDPADIKMSYRNTKTPKDWIFLSGKLRGEISKPELVRSKMQEIIKLRIQNQPQGVSTGGSTFINPKGLKSWQLIAQAGCRELEFGKAKVSKKHCNFLINTGGASALEIETLGELVRKKVLEYSEVNLEWEIQRLGHHKSCH